MLVLVAALVGARGEAAPEETPDAQLLLDLDLLTQPEARDRDFMRRLSLFERLRLLELFRVLDETPAAAARRPRGPAGTPPCFGVPAPPPALRPPRLNVLDAAASVPPAAKDR